MVSNECHVSNHRWSDCLTTYTGQYQREHQSSASLAFCEGNQLMTGAFPSQVATNMEKFQWHNVIMYVVISTMVSNTEQCNPHCLP